MDTFRESKSAFLTGSHAYGVPREDSDVDLVIYTDSSELTKLAAALGTTVNDDDTSYPSINIKEGKLNLIVTSEPGEYAAWLSVTRELKKQRPVSREKAVLAFRTALGEI